MLSWPLIVNMTGLLYQECIIFTPLIGSVLTVIDFTRTNIDLKVVNVKIVKNL